MSRSLPPSRDDLGPLTRLRTITAVRAMRLTAQLSRLSGRGEGSIIGGRVGLALSPDLVGRLAHSREIAVISGTNGKTTTTRLLVEALGGIEQVATSPEGSNMPAGIATALGRKLDAPAVLEIDEGYLPGMLVDLDPKVVVLLNLSRDQLDRVGEVRMIASRWREAIKSTYARVVANADDPLVVFAAQLADNVRWVGAGTAWNDDAFHCPNCDGRIIYEPTGWSCSCGFSRPTPCVEIDGDMLVFEDATALKLETLLPGRFNLANLAMATVAAVEMGVDPLIGLAAMSSLNEVAGRFAHFTLGTLNLRLLLAKNPAGWSSLIGLTRDSSADLLIAINARIADGHDPSWLFDVPFEQLQGRSVVVSGDRRFDLAVRLRHAGVEHRIGDQSPYIALGEFDSGEVDVIANYTAFQDLRRELQQPPQRILTHSSGHVVAGVPAAMGERNSSGVRTALRIVVVYPELLGTYGDSGNGLILANRARWRGIDAELAFARADESLPLNGDIYLIGGGEDGPQVRAAEQLRSSNFAKVVDQGAVVFAVCAGYQIIGRSFPGADGVTHEGLNLLDVITERTNSPRAVGELLGHCLASEWPRDLGALTGFENHASHTKIGPGARPFMQTKFGVGNGSGGFDGAYHNRVIGTYLHGPALARNPALADLLLGLILDEELSPLDDREENLLRAERFASLGVQ